MSTSNDINEKCNIGYVFFIKKVIYFALLIFNTDYKKLSEQNSQQNDSAVFYCGRITSGLGAYAVYMSRAHSYLSDDPSACVNCHIMTPYYQSWNHSSHAQWANCNDCHMPYISEGGIKYSNHQVMSPLKNISNTCQTCLRDSEEKLRNYVWSDKCNNAGYFF